MSLLLNCLESRWKWEETWLFGFFMNCCLARLGNVFIDFNDNLESKIYVNIPVLSPIFSALIISQICNIYDEQKRHFVNTKLTVLVNIKFPINLTPHYSRWIVLHSIVSIVFGKWYKREHMDISATKNQSNFKYVTVVEYCSWRTGDNF